LQEIDLSPIAEVAKRHGVSESPIYSWRKKFGDLGADDVKRLKQLEQESGRLKKILAERDHNIFRLLTDFITKLAKNWRPR
jgi:putative transposase